MFSGIIQELGKIVKIKKYDTGSLFSIKYVNSESDIKQEVMNRFWGRQ